MDASSNLGRTAFGNCRWKVPISLHGASVVHTENGRITSWSDYYDGLISRRTALASYFTEWVEYSSLDYSCRELSKLTKEIAAIDRQSGPVQLEPSPRITQGLQHIATEPPAWAENAGRVIHYLMTDFGGGRRWLKLAWVINFQKLATIPLLTILIFKYQNFST